MDIPPPSHNILRLIMALPGGAAVCSRSKDVCSGLSLVPRRLLAPCAPACPCLPLVPIGASPRVRPPPAYLASPRPPSSGSASRFSIPDLDAPFVLDAPQPLSWHGATDATANGHPAPLPRHSAPSYGVTGQCCSLLEEQGRLFGAEPGTVASTRSLCPHAPPPPSRAHRGIPSGATAAGILGFAAPAIFWFSIPDLDAPFALDAPQLLSWHGAADATANGHPAPLPRHSAPSYSVTRQGRSLLEEQGRLFGAELGAAVSTCSLCPCVPSPPSHAHWGIPSSAIAAGVLGFATPTIF